MSEEYKSHNSPSRNRSMSAARVEKVCAGKDAIVCVSSTFFVCFRQAKVSVLSSGVGDTAVPSDAGDEVDVHVQAHLPTHAGYDAFVISGGGTVEDFASRNGLCPKSITHAPRVRNAAEAVAQAVLDMHMRFHGSRPAVFDSYMVRKVPSDAQGVLVPKEDVKSLWKDWPIHAWDKDFRKTVWYALGTMMQAARTKKQQLDLSAAMTAFSIISYENHVASKEDSTFHLAS